MILSLFLMLASETYCKLVYCPIRVLITHLFCSQYVVFMGPFYDPISCLSVYKLVRFYIPSSEDEYETTRATLTVFSGYRLNYSPVNCADMFFKAIVAMILLLATFGVGVRCFSDFGKGLYESKTSGQLIPRCLSLTSLSLRFNTERVL